VMKEGNQLSDYFFIYVGDTPAVSRPHGA